MIYDTAACDITRIFILLEKVVECFYQISKGFLVVCIYIRFLTIFWKGTPPEKKTHCPNRGGGALSEFFGPFSTM